jgi:hypothetical protein
MQRTLLPATTVIVNNLNAKVARSLPEACRESDNSAKASRIAVAAWFDISYLLLLILLTESIALIYRYLRAVNTGFHFLTCLEIKTTP